MVTKFQHRAVQALYDKLNSYEVFQLQNVKTIHETIYPFLEEVIYDSYAYAEAVLHWPLFQIVIDVVENGNKEFVNLTDSESMCYSLWWHTDHTHFENPEFTLELLKIFKGHCKTTEEENTYVMIQSAHVVHI
jgi:hypothetical protein